MLILIFDRKTAIAGAPVNITPPIITGTVAVSQTLTGSNGTWTNSPTSFTYQWQRDGVNIAGATGNTYVIVTADVGHKLRIVVTATNAFGSGVANSAQTGVVPKPSAEGGGARRKRMQEFLDDKRSEEEDEQALAMLLVTTLLEE